MSKAISRKRCKIRLWVQLMTDRKSHPWNPMVPLCAFWRWPLIRVMGPQFAETAYISEVNRARKVKSDEQVATNKISDPCRNIVFWHQQRLVCNVPFYLKFALKVTHPSLENLCWCQKSRVITYACDIKIWAVYFFVSSQSTRVTDRQTDRRTEGRKDGRTDKQNYDPQGRASIAASRGKKMWLQVAFAAGQSRRQSDGRRHTVPNNGPRNIKGSLHNFGFCSWKNVV